MAESTQTLLIVALIVALWQSARAQLPKFLADDPIHALPASLSVKKPVPQKSNHAADFFSQSKRSSIRNAKPAGAVNTLGEVPDSEWYINRHAQHRMSRDQLKRGPGSSETPVPPFTVIAGKTEGITPGFRMKDSKDRTYFVKVDPLKYRELTTAADVIVSKFLYAIGYNTPDNEIVDLRLSDLRISPKALFRPAGEGSRQMTWRDLERQVNQIPHYADGSFRIIASLAIEGENIGPFLYEGTRNDDPNDIVPHEDRRDLRGLRVISAWLNNTDMKASNTLDVIVEPNGIRFIRHCLIDFGSALGSDGDAPKDARVGYEFLLPTPIAAIEQILSLGLSPAPWERVHYPKLRGVGNFESQLFDPQNWKSDYPNQAFMNSLPDDDYWAAKQVMAFTDDDIRAIVETGRFKDPRATEYMIATLAKRRDKIGQTYFSKILPLDHFRIENEELLFDDLAVQYGFHHARPYEVSWSKFDNVQQEHIPIPSNRSAGLPAEATQAPSGSYFSAAISSPGDSLKPVHVYLRKEGNGYKIVGADRFW
jgi:hypothetical protein